MKNYNYYLIDAGKKPLGRIATQAAVLLRGKNLTNFQPNIVPKNIVIVVNADKIYLSGTKNDSKRYYRYSGFHGGIKTKTFNELKSENPQKLIRHAVLGMLPKNRLRSEVMKNLKIYPDENHSYQKENISEE